MNNSKCLEIKAEVEPSDVLLHATVENNFNNNSNNIAFEDSDTINFKKTNDIYKANIQPNSLQKSHISEELYQDLSKEQELLELSAMNGYIMDALIRLNGEKI